MRIGIDMHVLQGMRQGSRTYLEGIYDALLRIPNPHKWHGLVNSLKSWTPPIDAGGISWAELGTHSKLGRFFYGMNHASKAAKLDCLHATYVLPARKRT